MKHSQRGYSLVELSLVLAIIAIVIAGSVAGVQSLVMSNNTNRTIQQTNQALTRITSKFAAAGDFSSMGTTAAAMMTNLTYPSMGIWEAKDVTGGGTASSAVSTPYGTARAFAGTNIAAITSPPLPANTALIYSLSQVPVAACVDLVMGVQNLAAEIRVQNTASALTVPETAWTSGTVVKALGGTINAATLAAACSPTTGTPATTANIHLLVPRS